MLQNMSKRNFPALAVILAAAAFAILATIAWTVAQPGQASASTDNILVGAWAPADLAAPSSVSVGDSCTYGSPPTMAQTFGTQHGAHSTRLLELAGSDSSRNHWYFHLGFACGSDGQVEATSNSSSWTHIYVRTRR